MMRKDFKVLKKLNPVWLPCTISGVRNKSERVMIDQATELLMVTELLFGVMKKFWK